MKPKRIATILLLAFVGVSVAYLVVQEARTTGPPPAGGAGGAPDDGSTAAGDPSPAAAGEAERLRADAASGAAGAATAHKVVVYYFHNTQRCSTCLKIEELSRQAVAAEFADALERGELEWRVLNMEEPPNEHFADDFKLFTSSLVIVDIHDGQQHAWSNMGRVWELVHRDEAEFTEYVASQVRAYLES